MSDIGRYKTIQLSNSDIFLRRTYYLFKPLLPRKLLIYLRRKYISSRRSFYKETWPIDEKAGKPPEGWTGWPEGKKFAVILTHDVETAQGRDKCLKLVELEKRLGFRSSFNFVPEDYSVFPELRSGLEREGFEVGLHGLKHNLNLYKSKVVFMENAKRINQYLKKWKSVGFRSPSMFHNLDWIGHFDILYDSSTFDTDPFEPQPDGVGTIFPFWVPKNDGEGGYVELPYTLPQDFTLFILMREKDSQIWKEKVDWIANKGGVVLLITHPDYMNVTGSKCKLGEYPIELYAEFLQYLRSNYRDQYWPARPMDLARFWADNFRHHGEKTYLTRDDSLPKHALFIVENQTVPFDKRVWSEASAAKRMGMDVTVIAPINEIAGKRYEKIEGIDIFRHPIFWAESGVVNYLCEYLHAICWEFIWSMRIFARKPFQLIHASNPPDTIFMIGLFYKIFKVKYIFDHHDLSPELYTAKFPGRSKLIYNTLKLFEKLSCKTADAVITTNESFKGIITKRHKLDSRKIFVVRNDPAFAVNTVQPGKEGMNRGRKKVVLYVGSINSQDGVDILIRSLHHLVSDLKEENFVCRIVGGGGALELVKRATENLKIESFVDFKGYLSDRKIVEEHIAMADICVEPAPDSVANRHSTFIKIMEYMAAGKPVVAFDLEESRYSLKGSGIMVEPGDIIGFARAIKRLIDDPELGEVLGRRGMNRIREELNWERASVNLRAAYRWISK